MKVSTIIKNKLLFPSLRAVRRIRRGINKNRAHQRHKQAADAAYEQIKDSTGRPDIDRDTSREIAEYCHDVLGSHVYQPWVRVYTLYQGRFKYGWIPDDFFELKILPSLEAGRDYLGNKRTLSRRLFATDKFPDLAYGINGQWFTTDFRIINFEQLCQILFADTEEVYLKYNDSFRGREVKRIDRSELLRTARARAMDCVIQRPVIQHDWFNEIYRDAVATLRITTSFLEGANPRFRASYLRVGYAGETIVLSDKSLRIAVVDDQGSLAPEALDEKWRSHTCHPDTRFAFHGVKIPYYREAVKTCLQFHSRLPQALLVGWDVGITSSGSVEIMEWNTGHTDIKFSEATVGPIFADCGFERLAVSE